MSPCGAAHSLPAFGISQAELLRNMGVFGMSGSGKTNTACHIFKQLVALVHGSGLRHMMVVIRPRSGVTCDAIRRLGTPPDERTLGRDVPFRLQLPQVNAHHAVHHVQSFLQRREIEPIGLHRGEDAESHRPVEGRIQAVEIDGSHRITAPRT